jgi:hypothetical protein
MPVSGILLLVSKYLLLRSSKSVTLQKAYYKNPHFLSFPIELMYWKSLFRRFSENRLLFRNEISEFDQILKDIKFEVNCNLKTFMCLKINFFKSYRSAKWFQKLLRSLSLFLTVCLSICLSLSFSL